MWGGVKCQQLLNTAPISSLSCSVRLTKLTVVREPFRSQWKTTSRRPRASWGRCSSERSTAGWLTTASPGPPPASCAAVRTRSGGKRMRSGQVNQRFWSKSRSFSCLLASPTATSAGLQWLLHLFQTIQMSSIGLFLPPPHGVHAVVKVGHSDPQNSQELPGSPVEMENGVTDDEQIKF